LRIGRSIEYRGTLPMFAKGTTIRTTLDFLAAEGGSGLVDRVLADLSPETRDAIARVEPTGELPYSVLQSLWSAADDALGADPTWAERGGAFSIESLGMQLYRGILLKRSPAEFLTQSVSLFQLYYHPGDMTVVFEEPGHAVLRLVGFDAGTSVFCRRQTGGLRCAITLAGGAEPSTRHVRCVLEGDAFCEWELRWK
jgi:hypothetical protein